MGLPCVSVIMGVFNEEKYIETSIRSILNQTHSNLELIVVDDYSTDRTVDVCNGFDDPRIAIFKKTTEARYLATARNIGISLAKGDYVALQDGDDYSHPQRIEMQLAKALENPGRRIVGCSIVRAEGETERAVILPEYHNSIVKGFSRIRNRDTIVGGTLLAPKTVMRKVPYRPQLGYFEDWDQLLRLFELGDLEFYNCQDLLYTYYIRPKGSLFKPGWIRDNLYVRHCQYRRKHGLRELDSADDLARHFDLHPFERIRWAILKELILVNRYRYLRSIKPKYPKAK